MFTKQQQLQYLHQIQKLNQFNILKDDVHLTYKYRNRKKATVNVHSLQDKIQGEIVDMVLDGGFPSTVEMNEVFDKYDLDGNINSMISHTLETERNRIHHQESKFVDYVVENHTSKYTQFMTNRIKTESRRIIDKAIIIEGQALEKGATPAQARQSVYDYAKTHGKARTKNIIKDAIHSQECNVSFIKAVEDEWRYKVWMNGNRKGNTRAWHIAKTISPVPIDEPFEIYGPYGKQLAMYPGDLNSGPENVANCRCYLRYTNYRPSGLRQTKFNAPSGSYLRDDNTQSFTQRIRSKASEVGEKVSSTISENTEKVKTKINNVGSRIRNRFKF